MVVSTRTAWSPRLAAASRIGGSATVPSEAAAVSVAAANGVAAPSAPQASRPAKMAMLSRARTTPTNTLPTRVDDRLELETICCLRFGTPEGAPYDRRTYGSMRLRRTWGGSGKSVNGRRFPANASAVCLGQAGGTVLRYDGVAGFALTGAPARGVPEAVDRKSTR